MKGLEGCCLILSYHSALYLQDDLSKRTWGVTLAQLVKASVVQTDVQRFESHLGHNLLSCGVFLVKSRYFGPSGTNIRPNWQSKLTWSLYKRGVFIKSIPEETRIIAVPSLSGL